MADETKSPVFGSTTPPPSPSPLSGTIPPKPSGPSPLTPDIKIPPNLPVRENIVNPRVLSATVNQTSGPSFTPPVVPPIKTPPLPLSPQTTPMPLTKPPLAPYSAGPMPAKSSVSSPLAPTQPPAVFKSSIRTMQEDLVALKKGQAPAGFQIEKQSEKEIKPITTEAPKSQSRFLPNQNDLVQKSRIPDSVKTESGETQKIPTPTSISHVELGKLEKSKPITTEAPKKMEDKNLDQGTIFKMTMESQKGQGIRKPAIPTSPSPQVGLTRPAINIQSIAGLLNRLGSLGSKKMLLWGGVGLVAIVAIVLIFTLGPLEPEVTFSPTPTATRTPTPLATPFIEGAFSLYSTVDLGVAGPNIFVGLMLSVNKEVLTDGEPGLYKIVDPQTGQKYSFDSFMFSALVMVPEEIKPFVDQSNFYLSLMQTTVAEYGYAFVARLKNDLGISQALSRWETNISTNLEGLFGLDIARAASVDFLDNTYQGIAIRYRNFPGPLKTIDYAVVTAANGDKYLVFTNSQEHIYAIIDNLR